MNGDKDILPAVTAFAAGIIFVTVSFMLIHFNPTMADTSGQIASTGLPSTTGQRQPDADSYKPAAMEAMCDRPYVEKPRTSETRYKDGTVIVVTNTPVYLLEPGTTGKLCMTYTDFFQGQSFSGKIYSQVVTRAGDTKNVTITPHPDRVTAKDHYFASASDAVENKTSFDIVYTISAPPGSAGFYGMWPKGSCGGLPFAIGYGASEINYPSDFEWKLGSYYGCFGGGLDEKITGLSGINVFYVTDQWTTNIGYEITGVNASVKTESLENKPNKNVTVTFAVHFRTYNETINVIANAKNFEIARFSGNPQLEKTGQCSWVPANHTSLYPPGGGSAYDDDFEHDSRYVKINTELMKIPAYSNDTHTFTITLANLPEGYYGLQPAIFVTGEEEPVDQFGRDQFGSNTNVAGRSIANFFPITIGDNLPSPISHGANESDSDPERARLFGQC